MLSYGDRIGASRVQHRNAAGACSVQIDVVDAGAVLGDDAQPRRELLKVLKRPEIPLHTNASENDLRACVTKCGISGGTMSADGRQARDVMLGLMKTCRKLGISFFAYLGNRLGLNRSAGRIPLLSELVTVQPT